MADPPPPDAETPQPLRPPPPASQTQAHKVYSNRATSALARLTQPFFTGSRSPSPSDGSGRVPEDDHQGVRLTRSRSLPGSSQTVTHRTGLSIASLDISPQKTHAVIAGREIFKTIRVSQDGSSEEFNLRDAIIKASSKKQALTGLASKFKDQLAIKDVKWSHGEFDTVIATAAANGRIITYDLQRAGLELSRLNGHSRQVHRLAFNPHRPAWLLSGSQDSTIRMWDLRSASPAATIQSISRYNSNSDAVRDIRWSTGDGTVFATATDSGAIQCWDYRQTKAPQLRIAAHEKPCYAVDWHSDGKHLVSAGTDKQVKVWDFSSSAERRQKPTFQFRAPQPVVNVRWRPASRASEFSDNRNWQSTQVVTCYDKEDPRIHLWDLRRPHIPYREIDRYETPAADLLWKSSDLLWTVGEAGSFTQTDIRFIPEVVSRRPMCAVAWSPTGEVVATVQKRPRRRALTVKNPEFFNFTEENERSFDRHQSFTDTTMNDISTVHPRHQKAMALGISKSLGNTPPDPEERITIVSLEEALSGDLPSPHQLGAIGQVEGVASDAIVFRYLAEQYAVFHQDGELNARPNNQVQASLNDLDWNAEQAEIAGQHKLAQTWNIVKYTVVQELEVRAEERRRQPKEKTNHGHKSPHAHFNDTRMPEGSKSAKVKSHLFKGVIETESHRCTTPEIESTSNMTTPLAKPLPDSPSIINSSSVAQGAAVTDDLIDLQPLPPSVMSSRYSTRNQDDVASAPRMQRHESESSDYMPFYSGSLTSEQARDGHLDNLDTDQRSAPRAIAGRADWRLHRSTDFAAKEGSEDDYEQKLEDRKALLRDYKAAPKKVLNLESLASETSRPSRPGPYLRHDSTESFPMFSASTDSSHRTKSVDISLSPRTTAVPTSRRDSVSWESEEDAILEEDEPASSDAASIPEYASYKDEIISRGSSPDMNQIHIQRPSSPAPLLVESNENKSDPKEPKSREVATGHKKDYMLPLSPDISASKPWSAQVILREAVRHYHSTAPVDTQMAAHLLRTIHSLFSNCETILPYHECEQVFKAYNEQLIRHSMYIEAAELRNFCVPMYPAAYEYAQTDTFINVYCYTCKKPYENPLKDNRRCYRCLTPQDPCPICLSLEPPLEWIMSESIGGDGDFKIDDIETNSQVSLSSDLTEPIPASELGQFGQHTYSTFRPRGSGLWSWCQGCGHGGHLTCMKKWLGDLEVSEGGCPTPGCVHGCGPGPRRQENREVVQTTAFGRRLASNIAKRDPWITGESRAVEKVRGMLTTAPTSSGETGSGSTTVTGHNTSSAGVTAGSSKKVRLVTPVEQDLHNPLIRDKESTSDPFPG